MVVSNLQTFHLISVYVSIYKIYISIYLSITALDNCKYSFNPKGTINSLILPLIPPSPPFHPSLNSLSSLSILPLILHLLPLILPSTQSDFMLHIG